MKLAALEQFLKDCIRAEIQFPIETMTVVVDDYREVVPEEKQDLHDLEFNVRLGQESARVFIIPQPPVNVNYL